MHLMYVITMLEHFQTIQLLEGTHRHFILLDRGLMPHQFQSSSILLQVMISIFLACLLAFDQHTNYYHDMSSATLLDKRIVN